MNDKIEQTRLALKDAEARVQAAKKAYNAATYELRHAQRALNEADRAHIRATLEAELRK